MAEVNEMTVLDQEIQELAEQIDEVIDSKAGAVSGMGFSTNDYTNDEKRKLAGIEEAANNYRLPIASKDVVGGVKTTSTVTQATIHEYTPTPIVGGVPYYKDTTYTAATQERDGLMSAEDKARLDDIDRLAIKPASADNLGGVKVGAGLQVTSDGTLSAKPMVGATEDAAGDWGMVPPAGYWQRNYFLRGDGFWVENAYTLPQAERDQLGGVKLGDYIEKVNGRITVPVFSGYGPGLVPAAESASKVLTGEGWKKLTPEHLPLIENDVPGLVRVPVLEAAPSGLLPDGYALPVAGSKDGKLYAQTPTIPEAHGALIEGATSGIWGPQSGLMPGADKDKLDGIDYKANHYVLPQATETELGGVKASVINNLSEGGEALLKQYSRIVVDEDGIAYADLGSVKERIAENVQTITNAEIDEICV